MADLNDLINVFVENDKRYNTHRGFKSLLRRKDTVHGYDYYKSGILPRHISGYLRGNVHVVQILEKIDKIIVTLLDKVKYIRNINNFYVDPEDTSIN